jgi:hypothetical protein
VKGNKWNKHIIRKAGMLPKNSEDDFPEVIPDLPVSSNNISEKDEN